MGNPIVWFEIGGKDSKKLSDFYSSVFDWKMNSHDGNTHFIETGVKEGIMGHVQSLGHPPHNYTLVYVQVDDIEASLKKIETAGGKRLVPMTEVPGMGHFAWFADPEGTPVGVWKPSPRS